MATKKTVKALPVVEPSQEERDRPYQRELSAMLQREYRARMLRLGGFATGIESEPAPGRKK